MSGDLYEHIPAFTEEELHDAVQELQAKVERIEELRILDAEAIDFLFQLSIDDANRREKVAKLLDGFQKR